jgi:antitoxin YokJ
MSLSGVLAEVAARDGCRVLPPAGAAMVPDGFVLPDDLRRFYELCGGAILFEGTPDAWRISGPRQLVPAGPRLLGAELARDIAAQEPGDLTNGCFVFAEDGPDSTASLVVVDLCPARAGRYYDAFWDSFGLVGQMPILALSVTELLRRLLDRAEPAPVHGDAYDDL